MVAIPDQEKAREAAKAEADAKVAAQIAEAEAYWRQQFFAGYRQLTPATFSDAELAAVAKALGKDKKVSLKEGNVDACNYVVSVFDGASKEEIEKAQIALRSEANQRKERADRRARGWE